ncbi:unnamed protein product [Spirodela intermedia]|uniref:non-specific serine/threonine protein kinase n=1 Tax=Spirodela intermedia TaxID=51605 RepID=A0A7I8L4W6_SPIIN|nr:unnamed protein product [Spirodela intermedia]
MGGKTSPDQELDDSDAEFVEVDPSGRYGRYREVLGKGAFKTVYRGFDELEGIEVAWNQVKVSDLLHNSEDLERLYSEVHLLKTLKHKNIIKFYNSWVDTKRGNINFITEIFTSGTLRQYRKKHKHVDLRALKNWSRQILYGLHYLHSHDPPVIHRDLKCDNIFVNGNQGEVKIGDLGLAAILRHAHSAHSVIGTPEFMAPELYEEDYNELVDIYAFGMCLLELVTLEYPYMECTNAAQIYKKVTAGIKPASLGKVEIPEVRRFIEKCIASASERLPAGDLLSDPFLRSDGEDERATGEFELDSDLIGTDQTITGSLLLLYRWMFLWNSRGPSADDHCREPGSSVRDFMVQGQRKDINTIFLKLRISDSTGHPRNIHFPFDIEADTSISVASEMVEELDLTHQDVTAIAAMIDAEIQSHVPEWVPGEVEGESCSNSPAALDDSEAGSDDGVAELPPPAPAAEADHHVGHLVLERLPSGRKYWSDSPRSHGGRQDRSDSFEMNHREIANRQESSSPSGSPNTEEVSPRLANGSGPLNNAGEGDSSRPSKNEPDNAKVLRRRLEDLLLEQEKEIEELKKKHKRAVADVLKEFPAELRGVTLGIRGLNLQGCEIRDEVEPNLRPHS